MQVELTREEMEELSRRLKVIEGFDPDEPVGAFGLSEEGVDAFNRFLEEVSSRRGQ